MSLDESRNKGNIDKSLERKKAIKMEEGILASVEALSIEQHMKKLAEHARLVALAGKEFQENPDNVVWNL